MLCSENMISTLKTILVVAIGTAFKQILLWYSNSASEINKAKKPFHCLEFHKGVIFSINFNKCHKHLISTFDDHSIRLWNVNSSSESDSTLEF